MFTANVHESNDMHQMSLEVDDISFAPKLTRNEVIEFLRPNAVTDSLESALNAL